MDRVRDMKGGFGNLAIIRLLVFLAIALSLGFYTYRNYQKTRVPAPPVPIDISLQEQNAKPGNAFIDAFGNTIPAISPESAEKLKQGCPRYLILGSNPTVAVAEIPANPRAGSCKFTFNIDNTTQEAVLIYQKYFKEAGWEDISTTKEVALNLYTFERPHQRVVIDFKPMPEKPAAAIVTIQNFYMTTSVKQ